MCKASEVDVYAKQLRLMCVQLGQLALAPTPLLLLALASELDGPIAMRVHVSVQHQHACSHALIQTVTSV